MATTNYLSSYSFRDHSGEATNMQLETLKVDDITAPGADANAFLTDFILALSDNAPHTVRYIQEEIVSPPSEYGGGQREDKILVKYVDDVTYETLITTLPCRDNSHLTIAGSDLYLLTAAPFAAAKTAFENFVRHDGHTVTVINMRLVGRNT